MKRKANKKLRQAFIEADVDTFNEDLQQNDVKWTPSDEFERKMKALIRERKRPAYLRWTEKYKRVACLALVFVVLFCFTCGVTAKRWSIRDFITNICEKFSDMFVTNNEATDPEIIEDIYLPTAIPLGYQITAKNNCATHAQTIYTSEDGKTITVVQQIKSGAHISFNTEGAALIPVAIGTETGHYFTNKGVTTISWSAASYVFYLWAPDCFSIEEVVEMAESVEMVDEQASSP